jgi:ankyrin repeat protein
VAQMSKLLYLIAFGTVQVLLEYGADVNAKAGYYGAPLQVAVVAGNMSIIEWLLRSRADVNQICSCYGAAILQQRSGSMMR